MANPGQNLGSSTRYLVRFDDICPTMNWIVWDKIEPMLVQYRVSPILAVIPENRDPKLHVQPPVPAFWDRVRDWQSRGWTIALHGYRHVYVNQNRGLLRITPQSEFAGLTRRVQEEKLRRGIEIFRRNNVLVDCWVAPSHSFDWTTVDLLAEMEVRVINDGLWPWPHTDERGITWVPQQVFGGSTPNPQGGMRKMPRGIWTFCHHHKAWSEVELENFRSGLERFSSRIIGLNEAVIIGKNRHLMWRDRISASCFLVWYFHVRPALGRFVRHMKSGAATPGNS